MFNLIPLYRTYRGDDGSTPIGAVRGDWHWSIKLLMASTTTTTTTTTSPANFPLMPTSRLFSRPFEFTSATGPCRRIETPNHPGILHKTLLNFFLNYHSFMLSIIFTGFYTGLGRLYKFRLGSGCTGPITVDFSPVDFNIRCGFLRDSVTIRDGGIRVLTRYCGTSPPSGNPFSLNNLGTHWVAFASFFSFRPRSTGFSATVCAASC